VEIAIVLTAVVHLLNNLFKLGLLWSRVQWRTVALFGLPGIAGAALGALLLRALSAGDPLFPGIIDPVDALDLVIAALMLLFGILELMRFADRFALPAKWMMPGGLVSGFFGGLSGHQGALRSLFLLRSGLGKEAYIATGVAIACLVDLTRLTTYATEDLLLQLQQQWPLLAITTLTAFLGAWLGSRIVPKVTMRGVQVLVGVLLLGIAGMLATGII
jgi:uncharacterized membrane protein YfcA